MCCNETEKEFGEVNTKKDFSCVRSHEVFPKGFERNHFAQSTADEERFLVKEGFSFNETITPCLYPMFIEE